MPVGFREDMAVSARFMILHDKLACQPAPGNSTAGIRKIANGDTQ